MEQEEKAMPDGAVKVVQAAERRITELEFLVKDQNNKLDRISQLIGCNREDLRQCKEELKATAGAFRDSGQTTIAEKIEWGLGCLGYGDNVQWQEIQDILENTKRSNSCICDQ